MRWSAFVGAAFAAGLGLLGSTAFAADVPTITINGQPLDPNFPPTVQAGHVLVPFRSTLEQWGAKVAWDPAAQTATATKGGLTIARVTVGDSSANINDTPQQLDPVPILSHGQVYAPIELIAQMTGAKMVPSADGKSIAFVGGGIGADAGDVNPVGIVGVWGFVLIIATFVLWMIVFKPRKAYIADE